jgi:hypothetical protein
MELGDLDGDAILDAVTAQGESVPWVNRFYRGVASAPPDRVAPALRGTPSQEVTSSGIVVRFAVSDGANSDGGPRLAPGGTYVEWMDGEQATRAPASWMGGDLFQAIVPVSTGGAASGLTIVVVDQAGNETRVPLADMIATPAAGEGSTMAGTPEGRAPVATPAS